MDKLKCNACGITDEKTTSIINSKNINKYKFEISFPNKKVPTILYHKQELLLCNKCYNMIVNQITDILIEYNRFGGK